MNNTSTTSNEEFQGLGEATCLVLGLLCLSTPPLADRYGFLNTAQRCEQAIQKPATQQRWAYKDQ